MSGSPIPFAFSPESTTLLRRLSGRRSLADIADTLDRHVSHGTQGCRCKEARAALHRIRHENTNFYVRAALRLLDDEPDPCVCVRKIIDALRKFGRIALR